MQEKLKDKFDTNYDYQAISNVLKSVELNLFGDPTSDADTLKNLIIDLRSKDTNFLGEIITDEESNQFRGLVYSTPTMKWLAGKYMDVLVMDTTFGTNRFRMSHWTMCGKDLNNKTIIFAEGLIALETLELFTWLLSKAKDYLGREPKFIMTDADPGLVGAVQTVYPNSNLKLCG